MFAAGAAPRSLYVPGIALLSLYHRYLGWLRIASRRSFPTVSPLSRRLRRLGRPALFARWTAPPYDGVQTAASRLYFMKFYFLFFLVDAGDEAFGAFKGGDGLRQQLHRARDVAQVADLHR